MHGAVESTPIKLICPEGAQRENIGETPTHVVFIELKEAAEPARGTGSPGPVDR